MLGEKVEFADKHVFLVQLSISLVREKPAKLHVATFGMADWKLNLAMCSLTAHVDLIAIAPIHPAPLFVKREEARLQFTQRQIC